MLIRFILVMTPLVFLINGITKGNWIESLLFAVSVAVGLTQEMLPMIVTANLAKGAVAMARRKTIVKRLNAIQNFGPPDGSEESARYCGSRICTAVRAGWKA
jgi:Mg2+-importing ATPase